MMRRTIVSSLSKHRARLLQRALESMERRLMRPNRTDHWLIAQLQTRQPSLEPLGPLAGKRITHTVGSRPDQPLGCSDKGSP